MDSSIYILKKVLKEHEDKDTEFYKALSEFLDKRGWEAMLSAMSGTPINKYPNILMPNGTLTQNFTSTSSANFVFYSPVLLNANGSNDYQISLAFSNPTAVNSPQMYFGVFDTPNSSGGSTVPTFGGMNGWMIYLSTGTSNFSLVQLNVYSNGTVVYQNYAVIVSTQVNIREIRSTLEVFNSNTQYGTTQILANVYTNTSRYLHFYRADSSSGNGYSVTLSQTSWN